MGLPELTNPISMLEFSEPVTWVLETFWPVFLLIGAFILLPVLAGSVGDATNVQYRSAREEALESGRMAGYRKAYHQHGFNEGMARAEREYISEDGASCQL
jgi:hypothetical protein